MTKISQITDALEDYLETIFLLIRDKKIARVKDISQARGVRSASVTPALRRLHRQGLIRYNQREYVDLTAEGEKAAIRIFSRHQLLVQLFRDVLEISPKAAEQDACSMEHMLSSEGMDHLARFLEYIENDPSGVKLIEGYRKYAASKMDSGGCQSRGKKMTIAKMGPGTKAKIVEICGEGVIRQRLLDMGIMPNVVVELERKAPAGDPIWIRLQGTQLSLRKKEAEAVFVSEG